MSAIALTDHWISPEEYLEGELRSETRHEYACGKVFAMAGANVAHNRIALNLGAELRSHLRGTPCEAFMNDMKVRLDAGRDTWFYYPDILVACDPGDNDEYFRRSPRVIVEVLSPSTERLDTSEKFRDYQSIPALEAYVLVAQDRAAVTVFRRANRWQPERTSGGAGLLVIPELAFSLDFARLYERTGLV